jgi:hypothetical protein
MQREIPRAGEKAQQVAYDKLRDQVRMWALAGCLVLAGSFR